MEVAIGIDCFDLIALAESKAYLRLFAGMQFLALIALLGMERYPLDVVLRQHWVLHRANLDMDNSIFYGPNRDMFFYGSIGCAGNDLGHLFAAAYNGNTAVLNLGNDITAMLANVKLLFHDEPPFSLIVLCMNFKVALGMVAGRADLRRFFTDHNVTAVAALPYLDLALGKDLRHLHIVQQSTIALLVVFFDGCDQTETLCQFVETFLLGGLGKASVHISPFIIFALCGREKIFSGVADSV
jgi:hypothetical protein